MKVNEGYIGKFSKNGNEYIHTGGVNGTLYRARKLRNCHIVDYQYVRANANYFTKCKLSRHRPICIILQLKVL